MQFVIKLNVYPHPGVCRRQNFNSGNTDVNHYYCYYYCYGMVTIVIVLEILIRLNDLP